MNKEEIIDKWIYNTPLMPLRECVSNAMDEYASQPQWISVEDRLPDEGEYIKVLTLTEWGESVELWKGTYFESEYPIKESTVTHWQPLPPSPIKTKTP